jgi:uncharacterized phage protein gp47/JayE
MPFSPRSRDTIATQILDAWTTGYAARGDALDTSEGSEPWMLAQSLGLVVEGLERQAYDVSRQILPDTAQTEYLDRHGLVEGVAREDASTALVRVTITGTPGATVTYGTSTLQSTTGLRYTVSTAADGTGTSVALSGGGSATIYARCQSPGTAGNLAIGAILTWSSTPASANPTATVESITTNSAVRAVDAESDALYAQRILARRRERPASGNRADWAAWAEAVDGVELAYVYPTVPPASPFVAGTLGTLTVCALGPAPGDSPIDTRIIGGVPLATLPAVSLYIEGVYDAHGVVVASELRVQLRPVTVELGNYNVVTPGAAYLNCELTVVLAAGVASPWAYTASYVVLGTPTPTTTTFSLTGDQTAVLKSGSVPLPLLVHVGTAAIRGAYYKVTPTTVTYNGGTGKTDIVVPAMPGAATVASIVLPGLPTWSEIRLAIFDLFDALGPGDTASPQRYPTDDVRGRSTLYKSALAAALVQQRDAAGVLIAGVAGVLSASVVAPSVDFSPIPMELLLLGHLMVHTV